MRREKRKKIENSIVHESVSIRKAKIFGSKKICEKVLETNLIGIRWFHAPWHTFTYTRAHASHASILCVCRHRANMRSTMKKIKSVNGYYCLSVYQVHLSSTQLHALCVQRRMNEMVKMVRWCRRDVSRRRRRRRPKNMKTKNTSLNSSVLNVGTVQHFSVAFPACPRQRAHSTTRSLANLFYAGSQNFLRRCHRRGGAKQWQKIEQTARIVRRSYLNHTPSSSSCSPSSSSLVRVYLSSCKR